MRSVNLFVVVTMKYIELAAIVSLGALFTFESVRFMTLAGDYRKIPGSVCEEPLPDDGPECLPGFDVALVVCLGCFWYHVMHINLLVNLRLALYRSCITFPPCMICWTPLNCLICKFGPADKKYGCQRFCADRCLTK